MLAALKESKGKWSAVRRIRLINSLGRAKDSRAVEPLSRVVATDPCEDARFMAVFALGQIGDPAGGSAVRREASSRWSANQVWAIQALAKMRDRDSVPLLVERLRSTDDSVRVCAANALGTIGDRAATLPLIEALDDPSVRRVAAVALARLDDPRALEPVRLAHRSAEGLARRRIGKALAKLEAGSDAQERGKGGTLSGSFRNLLGRALETCFMNGLIPIALMTSAAWDASKIKSRKQRLAEAIEQGERLFGAQHRQEELQQEAFDFLERAVKEFPESAQIRVLYASILLASRPEDVGAEAAKAAELGSDDPVTLVRAGSLLEFARQWDDVRFCVSRANELVEPNFVLQEGLDNLNGILAAKDHEYERAEELLRSAMAEHQNHSIDLAKFLVRRDRNEEALAVIDEALKHVKYKDSLERLRREIVEGRPISHDPLVPFDEAE